MIEELKKEQKNDLEDVVFRMELTYSEIEKTLDTEYIATSSTGYTLPLGIYEITDIELMLKSLLPDETKVKLTIDDIRLRSILTKKETIKFTRKAFFYKKLGSTQSILRQ